ncbi:phosphoglucomutase, alpha-D-glucose phosphate-specific [candidate division WOR-1 bacterium RIFOXYA12_FULL_43_27]|uniref:Phosphoglucomutase, alpha-D-glucose phosphate-specific n=1 Tax=candidate division WOR-1 bacterium RIFOXYC2_FULL_46_14 TaxID=1802587 RepID=A0A1F4UA39_UNCSA|nr:MAG: phosphoglucomutase, alpha-D-glucose phosphate-specific [candidate division WOR-1 bacterium RIFOXYA12_FULL_43_27]OGC20014.1 MAG: phosphoglucomutase, alpha-D-glucose phosphate-specific [candidate division WOR-1 bacterium RIFOXYB2_FULL_46_45]OGC32249.1 MAG: phosphoglucomutase, alpha-D-glucose phosphate-specific [candidate division WOR-1 bacterium RIFOXYA2_FULL_46_56]OGC41153.1 MAG: phosphoglucomutase, alpha-D-glucose phosphate-specific [candidate division WOR-1 bacterium RIFOXYC2_FULL_46_14
MAVHALAGQRAPREMLVNVPRLVSSYYAPQGQLGKVEFGTSGHRGSSLKGTFNELHIAATTQAICEYRKGQNITGPLFIGFDTHALSEPAFRTAIEVLVANGVEVVVHKGDEYTPTPVISHLILGHNKGRTEQLADGIIITPSHNGPQDGGFKYNPPHGGPADVDATKWIENRANRIMDPFSLTPAIAKTFYDTSRQMVTERDFISPFVEGLATVVDMEAIRQSGIKIGVDPMGGSGVHFWAPIAERYGLQNLEIVNPYVDPTFGFMTLDSDGTIRMDCSSPYAMASLIGLASKYDIAWGNDTDFDRHGIVCRPDGLMNPNHYLSVAIWYLLQNRPGWSANVKIGKTLVSSSMIDKVVAGLGKQLYEVPVGFKWFVQGLLDGSVAFGGEESAGASFLRMDGTTWTTDKDGFALTLLSAEILAKTGKTPGEIYRQILVPQYGEPFYKRADGPITDEQKKILKALQPSSITATTLAGLGIANIMTTAPGNGASIGGVKVVLADGSWFALRPSGTEPKMKLYIESFGGEALWNKIFEEAPRLIFG